MEMRLNAFFSSTADAIDIRDLNGNTVYVNPSFEETYGWKREEIIGKPLPIIPSYRLAQHNNMLEQVKLGTHIKGFETACIKKDGTPIEVSLTRSPIRDAKGKVVSTTGITRDITKQKQLEKRLKESEMRYRRLVERSPEPVVVYQYGLIQYANPACIQLLGTSSLKELIGKRITDYFHPESVPMIKNRIQELTQTGITVVPTEEKMMRADGTVIDVEVNCREYDGPCMCNDWGGFFQYASPSHETVLGFPLETYEGYRARD